MKPIAFLIGGVAVAFGLSATKKPTDTNKQPDKTEDNFKPLDDKKAEPAPTPSPNTSKSDSFPLQVGSKGGNVVNWQKLMINYFLLTNNPILKTDPMKLDAAGNPDGDFGPQTKRYSIAAVSTSVVKLETYAWLFARVSALQLSQKTQNKNTSELNIGDKVYVKGKRTVPRYRAKIEIKKNGTWQIPTFQQFTDYLKTGPVISKFDTVDFDNGELMGRIAQIDGEKIRVVVTPENNLHSWWANPMAVHKDYFVVSKADIFK